MSGSRPKVEKPALPYITPPASYGSDALPSMLSKALLSRPPVIAIGKPNQPSGGLPSLLGGV